jgi:integrase/recombinase XerD
MTTLVPRALMRAGRKPARKGAHLLRHALAPQLLHTGASLTASGARLRHHPLETTRSDAKGEHGAFRALALPWPGGEA